jgi:hypothetical protein
MAIVAGGKLRAIGTLAELRLRASSESSLEDIFFAVTTGAAENLTTAKGAE